MTIPRSVAEPGSPQLCTVGSVSSHHQTASPSVVPSLLPLYFVPSHPMPLAQDWPQVMSYSQKVPGKNVLLVFLIFAGLLLHTLKFDKHYFGPVAFQTLLMAIHFASQPSSPSPPTHTKKKFQKQYYPFYISYTVTFSIL